MPINKLRKSCYIRILGVVNITFVMYTVVSCIKHMLQTAWKKTKAHRSMLSFIWFQSTGINIFKPESESLSWLFMNCLGSSKFVVFETCIALHCYVFFHQNKNEDSMKILCRGLLIHHLNNVRNQLDL